MARHYVLGTDDSMHPKRSALVIGKEEDDDSVRRRFYAWRESGKHPDSWPFLELYGERGRIEVSFSQPKPQPKDPKK